MGNNRLRWNTEDMNDRQKALIRFAEVEKGKEEKLSKYRVAKKADRTYNNILFDSVKEMNYYKDLQLLQKAGEIVFFLRQVPFDLPGGVTYRVDFVEFYPDGSVRFIDVKGIETDMFIMKKKQVEALYPVKIIIL